MKSVSAITLFVEDPQRSKAFYGKAFGLTPVFEDGDSVAFRFENLIVNLLAVSAAPELISPASVGTDGARCQLTVGVENTDAACAELASKNVALLNGPLDRPWGVRTACFADPDGHIWEIAQEIE